MAATSDAVAVKVNVDVDRLMLRDRALELAVQSRGSAWMDADTIDTAKAYLAFLADETSTP